MNHDSALTFLSVCLCVCRITTPVYPLTETTAAAVWSWLTLSARRPSSSTETSRDWAKNETLSGLLLFSFCCLFYICGNYSETLTLYCIINTKSNLKEEWCKQHYLLWGCTCIFFWCTFSTKGLLVIKGFYCLYKIQSICICFIPVAWWWLHCGCCHLKSALEREKLYENI